MGADGIEIAQQHHGPVFHGFCRVAQNLFRHVFRPAVGVGAHARAGGFAQGHLVVAGVDRGRGREDDVFATVLAHHIKERQSTADVVFVIFPRLLHAFAYGFQSGEVDASIEMMDFHHLVESFAVADVDFMERNLFSN